MAEINGKEIVVEIPLAEAEAIVANAEAAPKKGGFENAKGRRPGSRDDRSKREPSDGLERKLVQVNRVTKVVKGGKNMRFNALVVVGDKAGKVGLGMGKAAEVPAAVEKAVAAAKKNMIAINIDEHTIPHAVIGKFGAATVLMMPAKEGTGVIAGGSARSVIELAGIKNITCKSYGSRNKTNAVKATLEGLKMLKCKEQYVATLGKTEETTKKKK